MLASQNSNLKPKFVSADTRESQTQPLLLKPTGVPVFSPVTTIQSQIKDFQTSAGLEGQSTIDTVAHHQDERMVRAKSFVIGKKVENQTGINLLDIDSTASQEKPFPVKVLYVKPTVEQKSFKSKNTNKEEITRKDSIVENNKENVLNKANIQKLNLKTQAKEVQLQKDFPKLNAVGDIQKIKDHNQRPKSATTQQLQKNQIKHAKLGPNPSVKPQISYMKKVSQSQGNRPQTSKPSNDRKEEKSQGRQAKAKRDQVLSPERPQTEIPFAQNRFQGKSESLTKELIKKAQEALKQEKLMSQKQKEEQQQKKEKQKQIAEQIKQKNQEIVAKQKEKGVERIDFRKKEEELKDQQRKEENKLERMRQKELRQKRKEEGRKLLGLEIFDQGAIEEYRKKIKEEKQKEEEEKQQQTVKLNTTKGLAWNKPENPDKEKKQKFLIQVNTDLKQIAQEKAILEEEEEKKNNIDRKQLLKEQKKKRKQQMLEQQQKAEEERKRKEEQMRQLETHLKLQKEELLKKQELKLKMKEEQERLEREMEEEQRNNKKAKKKKLKIKQGSSHKEQINDLKNWIEEQMRKEEENMDMNDEELEEAQKLQKIEVKIFDKKLDNSSTINMSQNSTSIGKKLKKAKQSSKQQSFDNAQSSQNQSFNDGRNAQLIKKLKYDLPGNSELDYLEQQKFEARDNRYGIFGDNGYGELIEIKRRDLSKERSKSREQSQERQAEVRLSKEGLITMISKIQEYQKLKEQEIQAEKALAEQANVHRKILIERYNEEQSRSRESSVPGVYNAEKALRQKKFDDAAIVIQKYIRGYLAKTEVQIKRIDHRAAIEEDIGYAEESVKFGSQQNLAKFLTDRLKSKDKQPFQNKRILESQSIQEKIGDSQSYSQSYIKESIKESMHFKHESMNIRESINIKESINIRDSIRESINIKDSSIKESLNYKQSTSLQQPVNPKPQFNNYVKEKCDKDPLSLIEIFAKKNAPKVVPSVVKSPIKPDQQPGVKKQASRHIQEDIEEEIYSESFERQSNGTIEEDIIQESKGLTSGSSSRDQKIGQKKQAFNYKGSGSMIEESIQEEYLMSVGGRSKRSPDKHESSIAEESHLYNQFSGGKSSHQKRQSLREESIEEIYEHEAFDSYSGSMKIKQKDLEKQRQEQSKKQIAEFESKLKADQEKRKGLVSELLKEMQNYEQANVSTVVVERMEKIINSSLAQKDKLLVAQRLNELEQEKNHKDEINRIREEQIKLLSQLLLLGGIGGGAASGQQQQSDEERKQIMENIQKIIEKPIVIQQQPKPQPVVQKQPSYVKKQSKISEYSIEEDFEEKSDTDYIEESKGLSRKVGDSSIQESIHQDKDDDSIAEEIEEIGTESRESEDEIKESVYVDGKKIKEDDKKRGQQEDKGLSKMRMALGSEEAIRQQSKQALKGSGSKNELKNSGLFEKNSFQDFTNKQFKTMLFDQQALDQFTEELEKTIEEKRQQAKHELKSDLKKNLISPKTYKKKELELEKWVTNERKNLLTKKQKMLQTVEEMGTFLDKLGQDKKIMLEKIGSPRVPKRLLDSQSSVEFDEIEESDESNRVRQARDQLKKISKDLNKEYEDPQAKEVMKKKAAALKLIQEKEKMIEEGLKAKLKEKESQQIDKMLSLALEIDVEKEIEKRLNMAKRVIEESSEQLQEEYSVSARSYSQSLGIVSDEQNKKKKKVNFASPQKFSSQHSQSSDNVSSKYKSNTKIEESIGESIKIEESYSISQHTTNQIVESKRSHQSADKVKSSIKDSIAESINEEEYSDDFIQSQRSDSKSASNAILQSKNKLSQKVQSVKDEEEDIEYSMNFDESLGQSQQLPTNLQQKQPPTTTIQKVDEEEEEYQDEDFYEEEPLRSQSSKVKEQSELEEEEEVERSGSGSIGTSSKLISSQAQEQVAESVEIQSEDKEVINSAKSIEWIINLEQQDTQRSKKQSNEDEDGYSDDFEKIEEDYYEQSKENDEEPDEEENDDSKQVDELDDLESCPDDIGQSSDNNLLEKAEKFTNEFLEILLQEIKESAELSLDNVVNLEDFKDKFPFNLEEEKKEEPKPVAPAKEQQKPAEKKAEPKKETQEDQIRAKFEKETKKLQEQQKRVEEYLNLIIKNTNKRDLIKQLEKPIDVDPLKKLAQIFSQEGSQEDSLNDTNHSYSVLPIEFFMKVEDQFRKSNNIADDLTESARSTYLNHESVHHRAIFDAFNQALDIERPYKDKGQPTPWSKSTRVVKPKLTDSQVDQILKKSKERVLLWSKTSAGTRIAPIPTTNPPPAGDYESNAAQPPIPSEEERLNQAREEKLGVLMMRELEENEKKWIDYEDEDTQVKFDLADMILEELAGELAQFMMGNRNQ